MLVVSEVAPNILGRTNAFPITLDGLWDNFDAAVIGTNTGLYIGSAYTNAGGSLFHPFVYSEDGTHMKGDPLFSSPPYPRVFRTGAIAGAETLGFDLRGLVPDNTKHVYLKITSGVQSSGVVTNWAMEEVTGGNPLLAGTVMDNGAFVDSFYVWVPVGGNQNDIDFLELEFSLVPTAGGSLFFQAEVYGWRT